MKTSRDDLVQALGDVARMALRDLENRTTAREVMEAATQVAMGLQGPAARRLRALRTAAEKNLSVVSGAEVHIALACEAFEKVYGRI